MAQDSWFFVAQFIALLSVPHAAALGISKLLSTSKSPRVATLSKVIDASAYITLAFVAGWTIHMGTDSPITATSPLSGAFSVYGVFLVAVTATAGVFVRGAKKVRDAGSFIEGLAASVSLFLAVAVVSLVVLFLCGVDLDPEKTSGIIWGAVAVLLVPPIAVVLVRQLWRADAPGTEPPSDHN